MKSNWRTKVIDEGISNEFSEILGIDKLTASILSVRGIASINEAFQFLNPRLSALHSPFLMKDMYRGVMRIRDAIEKKESIGIFADSDVDGLTSLTILVNLLERLGTKAYCRYAVEDETYGLRKDVIDEMHVNKINLIITVDCGIRDLDEINYARELGMDVIVCDHHEQKPELPPAIIINPKAWDCNYPFKELAGVGVTFKLCHGILLSYLQSFNKLFILIIRDNDGIYLSYIRNGITERIERMQDLNDGISPESGDSIFVIYDKDVEESLKDIDNKKYSFKDLLDHIPDKRISSKLSLDDLCKYFSINRKIFSKKYEIVNQIFSEMEYNNSAKIMDYLNSAIDLVSVGTVADIMPVCGENRTIIHHGLKSLNSTSHPGLSLLVKRLASKITAKKIAWDISPLLNTPGRFGKTDLLARFFLEKDKNNLTPIISEISSLNERRKKMISDLYNIFITEIINGEHVIGDNLVFIASDKVPDGLCGLLANRLADAVEKPVIIISLCNDREFVKGSGRVVGDFNFFKTVEPCSSLFQKIGGHKQAFGFTISRNNIDTIKAGISESISDGLVKDTCYNIDLDIPIEAITCDFINSLDILEPYGYKNDECLFLSRKVGIRAFKKFGKNMNHGKYIFNNNKNIEAIGWDMADSMEEYYRKKEIDVLYRLENNIYNGHVFPRMLIVDLD